MPPSACTFRQPVSHSESRAGQSNPGHRVQSPARYHCATETENVTFVIEADVNKYGGLKIKIKLKMILLKNMLISMETARAEQDQIIGEYFIH